MFGWCLVQWLSQLKNRLMAASCTGLISLPYPCGCRSLLTSRHEESTHLLPRIYGGFLTRFISLLAAPNVAAGNCNIVFKLILFVSKSEFHCVRHFIKQLYIRIYIPGQQQSTQFIADSDIAAIAVEWIMNNRYNSDCRHRLLSRFPLYLHSMRTLHWARKSLEPA